MNLYPLNAEVHLPLPTLAGLDLSMKKESLSGIERDVLVPLPTDPVPVHGYCRFFVTALDSF
jgi:hypothetical protein